MQWDFEDQLQMSQRQKVNDQDADGVLHHGERTWYVYDSTGQRVRKVTELPDNGGVKDERIYLGGFEIYRKNGANPLVRETLHIMDDKQRMALVETRTQGNEPGVPQQLTRFQLGNHLGSASLDLDDQAQLISYEEYTPYGSTAYQAVRSQAETPKRYRYTGKEYDEESGLYYHEARYYAAWLGRWTSCDPNDSENLYSYGKQNPIFWYDPVGKDDRPWYERAASAVTSGVSSVWSDAVEGSKIMTEAVSRGAEAAGNWVQAKAEAGASRLREAGYHRLAKGVSAMGVVGATATYTVTEVVGQTLAAGPNAVLALQRGGENIGTGAARIATADDWTDATLGGLEVLAGAGQGASAALTFLPAGRPAAPKPPASGNVPGRVQSRINLAEKPTRFHPDVAAGKPMEKVAAGMKHVRKGHTGGANKQSQFVVEPGTALSKRAVVKAEARPLAYKGSGGTTYARHAEVGTTVGRTRVGKGAWRLDNRNGGRLTNALRVETDAAGNVITAYPIQGWVAEFNIQMASVGFLVTLGALQRRREEESVKTSVDPSVPTPAEIEAQQRLPKPYRYR
jgi:RHS repeat-associated protein